MLHVNDLSFRHGERVLFDRASAAMSDGWKVGLVGRNGAGKSTLLRLIQGEIEADGGSISLSGRNRIGSVPQDPPGGSISVLDAVLAADVERTALLAESEACHDGLRLADIHARLDEIGAASAPARAASILHGLGFDNAAQARPCGEFSGGWRMRVALAGTLFSNPDLLILDEPSNHLDLEAMLWLTEHLQRFRHTLLMVSHDRDLLNDVCDHIVHIDQQKLVTYNGNYDRFERTRAERLEHDAAQQAKIAAQRKHMQAFVDRFKAKASKARQAQSRVKMIEKLGPVVSVPIDERVSFNFPPPEQLASPIETLDEVSVGYADGPLVLRKLDLRLDMDDRIALLGQNGNGKSTFIRLLSDRLQPREGKVKRTPRLRIGYFSQDQEEGLDYEATPFQHMSSALGPGRRRDQGARPARPLRLLARPRRPQGRRAVGRREDAAAAVAGDAQRPSPAAARRADQPSRHGRPRLPGRRRQRLRGRRRAGEPRYPPGEDGRRPALGGGGRQGDAVRRRHRRLPGQAAARTQRRQERQGRQARARTRAGARARERRRPSPPPRISASSPPTRAPNARRSRRRWRRWRRTSPSSTSSAATSRPGLPIPRSTAIPRSTSPICSATRSGWSARSPTPSTSGWWRRKPTKRRERVHSAAKAIQPRP